MTERSKMSRIDGLFALVKTMQIKVGLYAGNVTALLASVRRLGPLVLVF